MSEAEHPKELAKNETIPPEYVTDREREIVRRSLIPSVKATDQDPEHARYHRQIMNEEMSKLVKEPDFVDAVAKMIMKNDRAVSVPAKALELALVAQYQELTKLRVRIHNEINEASRQIRQDYDKLNQCVDKINQLMKNNDTKNTVEVAERLADSMTKLYELHEKGALEKMAAAMMGIK